MLKIFRNSNKIKKEEYIESLILNNCFNRQDAKEVVEIIIKEEKIEVGKGEYDFSRMYDYHGARWSEEEVVEYINDDYRGEDEKKVTVDDIMKWENFYRLKSGLIISWKY
jgi:hypothetical protein